MELVETELLGHRRRNLLAVAREHDGALDAGGVQVADRLLGIGLDGVGNYNVAGIDAIDQHVKDRTDDLAIGRFVSGRGEHFLRCQRRRACRRWLPSRRGPRRWRSC